MTCRSILKTCVAGSVLGFGLWVVLTALSAGTAPARASAQFCIESLTLTRFTDTAQEREVVDEASELICRQARLDYQELNWLQRRMIGTLGIEALPHPQQDQSPAPAPTEIVRRNSVLKQYYYLRVILLERRDRNSISASRFFYL